MMKICMTQKLMKKRNINRQNLIVQPVKKLTRKIKEVKMSLMGEKMWIKSMKVTKGMIT